MEQVFLRRVETFHSSIRAFYLQMSSVMVAIAVERLVAWRPSGLVVVTASAYSTVPPLNLAECWSRGCTGCTMNRLDSAAQPTFCERPDGSSLMWTAPRGIRRRSHHASFRRCRASSLRKQPPDCAANPSTQTRLVGGVAATRLERHQYKVCTTPTTAHVA